MNRRQAFTVVAMVTALIVGMWAAAQAKDKSAETYTSLERFIQVLVKVRDYYTEPITSKVLIDSAIRGMVRGLDPDSHHFTEDDVQKLQSSRAKGDADDEKNIERFIRALAKVRDSYPEPVTSEVLIDFAIRGMLGSLDPYSQYSGRVDPQRLQSMPTGGIGISIGIRDGWITAISATDGGPALRAGIQRGDRVIKIDGISTEDLSLEDVIEKVHGEEGTKVVLTVLREGRDKPIEFTPVRSVIQIKSVPYAGALSNGVGYIRLSSFSERSREEMDLAFAKIEKLHPRGLILDFRYNPGGLLSQAVEVAEEFTPRGKKIVYTRGRDPSQNREFLSTASDPHTQCPLIILVNQWTASGSEIVSGAVQDLDLGVVVGKPTFGNGVVQTVILLTRDLNGPKLKLTTAKFYTPSGRYIQKGEPRETVLPEFHTAMGRVVYGGGGIVPDLELEEVHPPRVIEDMESKEIFSKYAAIYAGENKNPPAGYAPSRQLRENFASFLKTENFEYQADSLAGAQHWVDAGIRQELARRYGGDEEAYRVAVEDDEQVKAAAALLDRAPTLPLLFALISELKKVKAAATQSHSITR